MLACAQIRTKAVLTTHGSVIVTPVVASGQHVSYVHLVFTLKFKGVHTFLEQYYILSMHFSVFLWMDLYVRVMTGGFSDNFIRPNHYSYISK